MKEEKYKVLKEIGSGSFGKVYEGICLETNEKVAIKRILKKNWKIVKNRNILEMP